MFRQKIFLAWRKVMRTIIIIVTIGFFLILDLHAFSYIGFRSGSVNNGRGNAGFGDWMEGYTARSIAMGGTTVALSGEGSAVFTNPAHLIEIPRLEFQVSPGLISSFETARHHDQNRSFNENRTVIPSPPLISFSYRYRAFTLGLGTMRLADMSYAYEEEKLEGGIRVGENTVKSSGGLDAIGGAVAGQIAHVSLGISYYQASGSPVSDVHERSFDQTTGEMIRDLHWRSGRELRGNRWITGISWSVLPHVVLSGVWKSGWVIKEEVNFILIDQTFLGIQSSRSLTQREWKMPMSAGLGIRVNFPGSLKTQVVLEYVNTPWNKSSVREKIRDDAGKWKDGNSGKAGFANVNEWRVGIEHGNIRGVPIRYGVGILPFYGRERATVISLGFGSGFRRGPMIVDFGVQLLLRQTSNTPRVFTVQEDSSFLRINQDDVNVITTRLSLTIKYRW